MTNVLPFKIKSVFYAKERLKELERVPQTPNGEIDYWKASQLLCEKDGGRLPTMAELAQLASYMYEGHIPTYADVASLEIKQIPEAFKNFKLPFFVWSSEEGSSSDAYYRSFGSTLTDYYDGLRYSSNRLAVCLSD